MNTNIHFLSYLSHFFIEREEFQTNLHRKLNTYFVCVCFFLFRKWRRLWDNVEKYCWAEQAIGAILRGACQLHSVNPHSQYLVIIAFTLQQWLQERASVLLYIYIVCIVGTQSELCIIYKVVQIWPGLFTLVYKQISPGHIWTTLYMLTLLTLCRKTGVIM